MNGSIARSEAGPIPLESVDTLTLTSGMTMVNHGVGAGYPQHPDRPLYFGVTKHYTILVS
ncbi:MAG: hypothetical protein HP491_12985 [Nitrospira sp.]|nr:hypothetical protein [Nitrospira sp.]MBH0182439.1 hypothetical protein [Nitrospira sp.]MBH0184464.1 hypothetical protein [Nitrospira sp.]